MTPEPTPLSAMIEALLADTDRHVYGEVHDEYGVSVDLLRATLDAARATVPAADAAEHDAGICPTCGSSGCVGRLQYEDCRNIPAADDRERLETIVHNAFSRAGIGASHLGEATVQQYLWDAGVRAGVSPSTGDAALREALSFIADWAHDCIEPGGEDYGFPDIERMARAALGYPSTVPEAWPDHADMSVDER